MRQLHGAMARAWRRVFSERQRQVGAVRLRAAIAHTHAARAGPLTARALALERTTRTGVWLPLSCSPGSFQHVQQAIGVLCATGGCAVRVAGPPRGRGRPAGKQAESCLSQGPRRAAQ